MTPKVGKQFLSLTIRLNPLLPAREVAVAWLSEAGFDMFETASWGVVAHGSLENIQRDAVAEILSELSDLASISSEERISAEENWNATWEREYEPIDVEGRAMMRAPFHAPPSEGLDVVIQPAMSFGTGHHPTTWLMLKAVLDERVMGCDVLDMGAGTGVLGIAAWKRGANRVICIDIEERAHENAMENFERNGGVLGTDAVEFRCGGKEAVSEGEHFDLLLANINRNVLLDQFPMFDAVLRPNGRIWTSGFFPADVPVLDAAATTLGWSKQEEVSRGDWAAVCWQKG